MKGDSQLVDYDSAQYVKGTIQRGAPKIAKLVHITPIYNYGLWYL